MKFLEGIPEEILAETREGNHGGILEITVGGTHEETPEALKFPRMPAGVHGQIPEEEIPEGTTSILVEETPWGI